MEVAADSTLLKVSSASQQGPSNIFSGRRMEGSVVCDAYKDSALASFVLL